MQPNRNCPQIVGVSISGHLSSSTLKKECKAFYGTDFERLLKEKNNLRQAAKYASDPDVRKRQKESSKKAYKRLKKKQAVQKEKQKIENEEKDTKIRFEYKKSIAKNLNALYRKKLQWVIDCFDHFLETFPQVEEEVRSKMINIGNGIQEKYEKMKMEIDEILEKVEKSENVLKRQEIVDYFCKGRKEQEHIQHDWNNFEWWNVGKKINDILENIQLSKNNKDWFIKVQEIQMMYEKNHCEMVNRQKYYSKKVCIICNKEPNCLRKNWVSKEQHDVIRFMAQSKFMKHNKEYLRLVGKL